MKRFRFSIASLLILVLFVGVAVAALLASSDEWDSGVFGLTFLTLMTAVLLAIHRTDLRRAFWLGFALFGWSYLVAILIPPVESRLPTTKILSYLDSKMPGRLGDITLTVAMRQATPNAPPIVAFSPRGDTLATSLQGKVRVWDAATGKVLTALGGNTQNFIHIGHSLLAWVLAFAGGCLSRALCDRGRGQRDGDPVVVL